MCIQFCFISSSPMTINFTPADITITMTMITLRQKSHTTTVQFFCINFSMIIKLKVLIFHTKPQFANYSKVIMALQMIFIFSNFPKQKETINRRTRLLCFVKSQLLFVISQLYLYFFGAND